MRRWTYMALTGLIVLVFILVVFSKKFGGGKDKSELRDSEFRRMRDSVEAFNAKNVDLMVYGRDVQGETLGNLDYRRIYDFTDEALDIGKYMDYTYHMIVINDTTGELYISDEQWEYIKGRVFTDDFYLVVLGPGKFEQMVEAKIISSVPSSNVKSVIVWDGGISTATAFADNPELVPYYVEQDLDEQDVPFYTMIMELTTKAIFWT